MPVPQLSVSPNPALALIELMLRAGVAVTVTVSGELGVSTACGPKVRLGGERVTIGGVPEPVKGSDSGLSGALSVIATLALSLPTSDGVKVTVTEQLLPARTDEPQLLVWAKSPLLAPVT